MVLDDHFWVDVKLLDFIESIYEVIKFIDLDKMCLEEINEKINFMCEWVKKITHI